VAIDAMTIINSIRKINNTTIDTVTANCYGKYFVVRITVRSM
jgi:hypothetical protein